VPRGALNAITVVWALLLAQGARATTFYVSPAGRDSAAGTSPASAWRSVARVNATRLAPGDAVLFHGGGTFAGLLKPQGSGTSASPIRFGSYGGGRANLAGGIELQSQSWLSFDLLRVDTGAWRSAGTTRGIDTSYAGSGVQDVVVRNCEFVNVAIGMLFSNHRDRDWTIARNLIRYTRDSGILIFDPRNSGEVGASRLTFDGNRILDTGLDTSIPFRKHAVYDIGRDVVWRNNVVRRFSVDGFSLRARGDTLIGNTIADGPYAIYYSPYDSTRGKTTISNNHISNVSSVGIELAALGHVMSVESFLIEGNSIRSTGSAPGIRVHGTSGSVTIMDNTVETERGALLWIDRLPGGGLIERSNIWGSTTGTPSWRYLGAVHSTLGAYAAASGQGESDRQIG
jgi:hypothetical protein